MHGKQLNQTNVEADSAKLPIWRDDSKSPATIKHVFGSLMTSTNYLNPGKTSVIGLDQPFYAIAKKIQWHCAEMHGKGRLVLMLGNLQIKMVILSCLDDWLEDSGWTTALSNVGVTMRRTCHCKN